MLSRILSRDHHTPYRCKNNHGSAAAPGNRIESGPSPDATPSDPFAERLVSTPKARCSRIDYDRRRLEAAARDPQERGTDQCSRSVPIISTINRSSGVISNQDSVVKVITHLES